MNFNIHRIGEKKGCRCGGRSSAIITRCGFIQKIACKEVCIGTLLYMADGGFRKEGLGWG